MEKIGHKETKWLFFILMFSNALTGGIRMLINEFAAGACISLILSAIAALLAVWVTNKCLDGRDLPDAGFKSPGGIIVSLLCLMLFCLTVLNAGTKMKIFAGAIGDTVLLQSPGVFVLFLMAGAALAVMLLKLEAVTRYSLAASTVFLVFLLVIVLTTFSEADITNVYPLMGKGNYLNILHGIYIFSDVLYFYVISSHIKKPAKARRVPYKSIIISGFVTGAILVVYTLCVPYPVSGTFEHPLYRLALLANSSVVFQRLDGLVFIIWIFSGFISSGALLLFGVMLFKKVFGLKNQNAVCPAVVLLCFAVSLWDVDFGEFLKIAMSVFSFLVLPLSAIIIKIKRGWKTDV